MEKVEFTDKKEKKSLETPIRQKRNNELEDQIEDVLDAITAYRYSLPTDFTVNIAERSYKYEEFSEEALLKLEEVLKDINTSAASGDISKIWRVAAEQHPELLKLYNQIVRDIRIEFEKEIKKKFEEKSWREWYDRELKKELDARTIDLNKLLLPEQAKIIRDNFPSGAFLVHTTKLDSTFEIIESGKLLTEIEVSLDKGTEAGRGGSGGIPFNMNDIRILTGTKRHFVGFMAAPETVLDEKGEFELIIPDDSAEYEVRLVNSWGAKEGHNYGLLHHGGYPQVPFEDLFLICSRADADRLKIYMSSIDRKPKGIIVYSPLDLRIESWYFPTGDHTEAGKLLQNMFSQAELSPSINWKDFFANDPKLKPFEPYVDPKDILSTKAMINTENGLTLLESPNIRRSIAA